MTRTDDGSLLLPRRGCCRRILRPLGLPLPDVVQLVRGGVYVDEPVEGIGKPYHGDRPHGMLTPSLFEPILESQPRHFLEISTIGGEKECLIGDRDAGHLEIHGADFDTRSAEALEKFHGFEAQ